MKCYVFVAGIVLMLLGGAAPLAYANECVEIQDDAARLKCYDSHARAETDARPSPPAQAVLASPERTPEICVAIDADEERLACYRRQQGEAKHRCSRKKNPDAMLYCFDTLAGRASADDRFVLLPKPSRSRVMLKSDAKPITLMGEIDAKPAELSASRRDGETFVDTKAALVWQRAMSQEWSWFGAGTWTRHDKTTDGADTRGLAMGLQWTRQVDSARASWWDVVTGSAAYEKDIIDDTTATKVSVLWEFGRSSWLGERWQFVPALGMSAERSTASSGNTRRASIYGIGTATWAPTDPVEFFFTGGYLDDFDVRRGTDSRDGEFGSVGVNYLFYDEAEEPAWRPQIRLVRYFGTDPLDPDAPANETRLTFGVLFDSLYR